MDIIYLVVGFASGGLLVGLLVYRQFAGGAYISRDLFADLTTRHVAAQAELQDKTLKIIDLHKDLASLEQINAHLEEKLLTQKDDITTLQIRFQTEFENISNRLLEEKSQKFEQQNARQIGDLLTPLRDRINEFGQQIDLKFLDETRERMSLKNEIENLRVLNTQLSSDAQRREQIADLSSILLLELLTFFF